MATGFARVKKRADPSISRGHSLRDTAVRGLTFFFYGFFRFGKRSIFAITADENRFRSPY